jgi:hypothetical protein
MGLPLLLLDSMLASVPPITGFPIFLDDGINATLFAKLAPIPRIKLNALRECPHPAGVWPEIKADGTIVNGGVPQLANLSLHLGVLNQTLTKYVPTNSTEWFDLDFESFNLLWGQMKVSPEAPPGSAYHNLSRELVARRYPSLNLSQVEPIAKAQYESAAMSFFLETISFVRRGWPGLKIGVYSYPSRSYYHGYNTEAGPLLRAQNDQLAPLWCALDGLFPSVYLFFDGSQSNETLAMNRAYVATTVAEGRRLADAVPTICAAFSPRASRPRPPVIPYIWNRYHSSGRPNWTYPFLSDTDMALYWEEGYANGADALGLWGDENPRNPMSGDHSFESFKAWWDDRLAPMLNAWKPGRRHAGESAAVAPARPDASYS